MKSSSQEKLDALETQYLQYLRRDTEFHQSIKEAKEFEMPLERTFVMLYASPIDNDGDGNNFSRDVQNSTNNKAEAAKKESPKILLSISTLLQEQQNIVLIGEPGSGKTTTLQYIAHSFGKDTTHEGFGIQKKLIPIIIRLRDVVEEKEILSQTQVDDWLLNTVSSIIQVEILQIKNLINRWKDAGRLFILFDGLDEVKEAYRFEIVKKIKHYCDLTIDLGIKIIVTSRKEGFRGIGSNFHEYELQPLSENIELFIENWIHAFRKDYSEEAVKDKARNLIQQIRAKLDGKQVMKNPLFLRLLIFQFINSGKVSETRSDVIDYFIKEELWKRAVERTSHPPSLDKVIIVLEYLAWKSQTEEEDDYEILLEKIQGDMNELEDARGILNFVATEIGLLNLSRQIVKKQIRFSHMLLREYFVARCIKKSWELDENKTWLFLKPLIHLPNWKEPLILLLNMLDKENVSKIINLVWKSNSPSEEWLRRDTLLVGEFLKNGAVKDEQLKHRILESLLHLYIQHKKTDQSFFDNSLRLNHIVAEPIESIFVTLPLVDQSYLASLSLPIAKGDRYLIKPSLKGFVSFLNNDFRTIKHLASHYDSDKSQFLQILSKLLRNLLLPIVWIIRFFTIPLSIPRYLNQIKTERSKNCTSAIETTSLFDHLSNEWIDFLILGLKNQEIVGVAAKILGEKAPRSEKVIQSFIELLHTNTYFSSNPINEIGMPIGMYCQRHPALLKTLITLVENMETKPRIRYRSIIALCKAAEVSTEALEFVFEISKYIREKPGTVYDDGTVDGFNDGIDSISVPSKDVVQYLLNLPEDYVGGRILYNIFGVYGSRNTKQENDQSSVEFSTQNKFETEAEITTAQSFDSPVIQCKIILNDGTIRYTSEDFTEHVFTSFLNSPRKTFIGNPSLGILIHWGWKRPFLIKRLINTVLDSNAYILAQDLQDSMSTKYFGQLLHFKEPIEDEMKNFLQKSIEQLRSSDSSIRQEVYGNWLKLAKDVPEESLFYGYHDTIERIKLNILTNIYKEASSQICKNWNDFNWRLSKKNSSVIFSALSNFRGTERIFYVYPRPEDGVVKKIQLNLAGKTLQAIDNSDIIINIAIDNLIKLVKNELPAIPYKDELFANVREESDYRKDKGEPYVVERMSAAFMLGVFAEDKEEIQDFLLSNLDISDLEKEGRSDIFNEAIFEIIGRIQNANPRIVVALLDISSNKKVYFARDAFRNFSHPSLDAVPVLVDAIKKLDRFNQRTILEALGSVDKPTLGLVDDLLRHLRSHSGHLRSSASSALGKIIEKRFDEMISENKEKWNSKTIEVFDSLIKVSSKTPTAAISLGNLAQRIGTLDKDTAKKQLLKAVNHINKILRRTPLQEFNIFYALGESGFEKTVNALGKVVAQIAQSEIRHVSNNLPVNIWSNIKPSNTSLQKVPTKPYSWIFKSPLLLIVSAIYFVISILIPKLLENLIPTTKLNWGTSVLLVGGLLIIYSIIDVWLRKKEK